MKKYFMQGTAEELKFGDMIELDVSKDLPNGHVKHHHLECRFMPELAPLLLEQGIIEEVDDTKNKEKKEKTIDKETLDNVLNSIQGEVDELKKVLCTVIELLSTLAEVPSKKTKPRRNARKSGREQED